MSEVELFMSEREIMKQHFKHADASSAVVKHVDALCATLPSPHQPSAKTDLRSSLKAAFEPRVGVTAILAEIKSLRTRVKTKFADAETSLASAETEIADLCDLKTYLLGQTDKLPDSLPADIAACAVSIRAAKAAGVSTSPALIGHIDDVIATGEATLSRMKGVVARRKAASEVGLTKGLNRKCLDAAKHPHTTAKEARIWELAAHRYAVAEKRAMARSKVAQDQFNKAVRLGA